MKTTVKMWATLAVAAVVFAAYQAGSARIADNRPKHELILSLVYILISPLRGEVGVTVKVGGKTVIKEKHVGTPWASTVHVPEGEILTFTSTRNVLDRLTMSCTIHDTNGHLHDQQDLQPGMGSLTCKASIL